MSRFCDTTLAYMKVAKRKIETKAIDWVWLLVSGIQVNAEELQYKDTDGAEDGLNDKRRKESAGVVFDPMQVPPIAVWQSPVSDDKATSEQVYVVDGHKRLAVAKSRGIPSIRGFFIEASTFEEAKKKGELLNKKMGTKSVEAEEDELVVKAFEEQQHPRGGKGTKQGGKFVKKGESGEATDNKATDKETPPETSKDDASPKKDVSSPTPAKSSNSKTGTKGKRAAKQADTQSGDSASSPQEDYAKNGVQAKAFKEWFAGSKVVTKDGDPKETHSAHGAPVIVYHGTGEAFDVFDTDRGASALFGKGAYFTEDEEMARKYAQTAGGKEQVISAYLSIRRPLDLMAGTLSKDEQDAINTAIQEHAKTVNFSDSRKKVFLDIIQTAKRFGESNHNMAEERKERYRDGIAGKKGWDEATIQRMKEEHPAESLQPKEFDGTISTANFWQAVSQPIFESEMKDVLSACGYDGLKMSLNGYRDENGAPVRGKQHTGWVVFTPTQAKSVDNEGTFDPKNPSILKAIDLTEGLFNG